MDRDNKVSRPYTDTELALSCATFYSEKGERPRGIVRPVAFGGLPFRILFRSESRTFANVRSSSVLTIQTRPSHPRYGYV